MRVADLALPSGVEVELDAETVIVSVQEAAAEEEAEATEETTEEAAE